MDPFEERVLVYLRENKGTPLTAYQVANAMGTAGAGIMLAGAFKASWFEGYVVGVQQVRNALERLVEMGYAGSRTEGGLVREVYYYAK